MLVLVAVLAAGGVRALLVQSFTVPSASMEPTLTVGQRVWAWRSAALTDDIKRGDVVVFDGRGSFISGPAPTVAQQAAGWVGLGPRHVYYVKRVIGVGGDTVKCCSAAGRLIVNGAELREPYVRAKRASQQAFDVKVPAGRVWLMGDNRDDSTDSRALLGRPGGGMIQLGAIVGTVAGTRASAQPHTG